MLLTTCVVLFLIPLKVFIGHYSALMFETMFDNIFIAFWNNLYIWGYQDLHLDFYQVFTPMHTAIRRIQRGTIIRNLLL